MTDEVVTLNSLPPEHATLARDARRQRRSFQRSKLGTWARQMEDAMTEFLKMRAAGMSREDGIVGLEIIVRELWPPRPARGCGTCDRTGYREMVCTHGMRCGRYRCSCAEQAFEHAYVVPCECSDGDRHRARVETPDDAVVAAGRTQKAKKGFSRIGS